MHEAAARNLRTAERFLLAPPLSAHFGAEPVAVCDISAKGARFRHERPLEMGSKSLLKLSLDRRAMPVAIEGVIVWCQPDTGTPGTFVSGVRTYAPVDVMNDVIARLQASRRSNRIEELRSTDRFLLEPSVEGTFAERPVKIENLSARGARIELSTDLRLGFSAMLRFHADGAGEIAVAGQVTWTAVKAIAPPAARSFRAGLFINEKPELLRLAIGQLCESGQAAIDEKSLRLKLKIMRARARQFAPSYSSIESTGVPAEQYLLIQGVREELRLNPDEAMHWYRRARLVINDPATRQAAPPIADHPDALAVWEYLDRSIDPSVVGRAFELPLKR